MASSSDAVSGDAPSRVSASLTSVSWIPTEAIAGLPRIPFTGGAFHYDEPPPDSLGSDVAAGVEALRATDRLRFANQLNAWIEVSDGRITGFGHDGASAIGATRVKLGAMRWFVTAIALPDIVVDAEVGSGWVRFTRTAGGRTGVPAPRTVRRPPYVQFRAPIAWTTLSITLHADGRIERTLAGASPFPRHWLYDEAGELIGKSGLTDFAHWWKHAFGPHTPWGDLDSPALVTVAETALERELSARLLRGGARPRIHTVPSGSTIVDQGDEGDELFVLLDGIVRIEVDGRPVAELGPGAVIGERAVLEGGRRTSTVRALTTCRVAVARAVEIEREVLETLASGHRREHG